MVTGARITYQGLEHIPPRGGAVVAINHTSYVDFLPAALFGPSTPPSALAEPRPVEDLVRAVSAQGGTVVALGHTRWGPAAGRKSWSH